MTPDHIAKMVHHYRKQSGLSQVALAKLSGVGKTAVFDIEKGKLTVQLDTLLKILETLNIQMTFDVPFPEKTDESL